MQNKPDDSLLCNNPSPVDSHNGKDEHGRFYADHSQATQAGAVHASSPLHVFAAVDVLVDAVDDAQGNKVHL